MDEEIQKSGILSRKQINAIDVNRFISEQLENLKYDTQFNIDVLGKDKMNRLKNSKIVLVDDDCIYVTNINRQIHATRKTLGKPKVEVMKERILEINPNAEVTACQQFYQPNTSE